MYKIFLLVVCLFFCKKEDKISEIEETLENQKFNTAEKKIETIIETKRNSDEVLSIRKNVKNRILEVSNDRNKVIWLDDKQITYKDLANPLTKSFTFPDLPENFSISSEGDYSVVLFPLANGSGCKMVLVSLVEPKPSYFSETYISCKNKSAVSHDGTHIYYFINDSVFSESILEPKKPKLIIPKEKFEVVYPNLKNRGLIYPIGKTFVIFFGNAGSYHLYWFNPQTNSIEKIGVDLASPKLYYANGKSAYIIGGVIGGMILRELRYTAFGKPILGIGFAINNNDLNPFPTSKENEFISGKSGMIYKWGPGISKKNIPIIAEKFWVVARDNIIYENKKKELILTSSEFTEEDWKLIELYNKSKNN